MTSKNVPREVGITVAHGNIEGVARVVLRSPEMSEIQVGLRRSVVGLCLFRLQLWKETILPQNLIRPSASLVCFSQ